MSKVQYRNYKKSTVRTRRAAKKYQPKLMDGDCVLAVLGGTITANAAGTLLPAIHSLTFFRKGKFIKQKTLLLVVGVRPVIQIVRGSAVAATMCTSISNVYLGTLCVLDDTCCS